MNHRRKGPRQGRPESPGLLAESGLLAAAGGVVFHLLVLALPEGLRRDIPEFVDELRYFREQMGATPAKDGD